LDEFFGFCYGHLEYRSLRFEKEILDTPDYQGNAVVNYTDSETPFTRVVEHKHFAVGESSVLMNPRTVISREFSMEWRPGVEPFYPVNDKRNASLYLRYKDLADSMENVIFGGRLAEYKYLDMAPIVEKVLDINTF